MSQMSYGMHDEKSLVTVAEQFEQMAADLRIAALQMAKHKLGPIRMTHQDSLTTGLTKITKWTGAVRFCIQEKAGEHGVYESVSPESATREKKTKKRQ